MKSFLSNKRGYIIAALVLAIIAGYFGYTYTIKTNTDVKLTKAKVEKSDLKIAFSVDGKITIDSYQPAFAISGTVSKVLVKEGGKVKKGQWLAILDTQEAQKELESSLRDFSKERNDFDQDLQVTYADKVITDTFKRILEKNQWDLDKAVLDVELKDLALKQTRVMSPIEGTVAEINIKEGSVVNTQNQTPIIKVVKPDSFTFIAYAEEEDALKISTDQTLSVSLEAYDKEFPSKLTFVSPLSTLDSNGISSYKITASIENPDHLKLMDGMEGSISFITKEIKDVITIPNKAVRRDGTQTYVLLIDSSSMDGIKTPIQTGFTDGRNVEVISGLSIGQEVIVN